MQSKVLLMGPNNGGKTSMRGMIFANFLARDTVRLGPSIATERNQVKFMGNYLLNLWDCGGQRNWLIEGYLKQQKQLTFSNVAVLIYTCDAEALFHDDREEWTKAAILENLKNVVEALQAHSPDAQVYCLLHKTDLLDVDKRQQILEAQQEEIRAIIPSSIEMKFFATSIWDFSLYDAWSDIIRSLIPNIQLLQKIVENEVRSSGALEVALFERATFLAVAHYRRQPSDCCDTTDGGTTGPANAMNQQSPLVPQTCPPPPSNNGDPPSSVNDTRGGGDPKPSLLLDDHHHNTANSSSEMASSSQQQQQQQNNNKDTASGKKSTSSSAASPSRVSTYFKKFRLACLKGNRTFQEVVIVDGKYTIVVMPLAKNTMVLVVNDSYVPAGLAKVHAQSCCHRFMEQLSGGGDGGDQQQNANAEMRDML